MSLAKSTSFVFDFEEKLFDNDAWLDYSSDLPKNDPAAETRSQRSQNNGAPFLGTFQRKFTGLGVNHPLWS